MNSSTPTSTPNRRYARQRIETLVYADLGSENGGFPINVSEEGMAFQGVRPLEKNQTLSIKFKLPGVTGAMSGTAEVVWLNESRKGGGLRFVEMPEESRRLISTWLSSKRPESSSNTNGGTTVESKLAVMSAVTPIVEAKVATPAPSIAQESSQRSPQTRKRKIPGSVQEISRPVPTLESAAVPEPLPVSAPTPAPAVIPKDAAPMLVPDVAPSVVANAAVNPIANPIANPVDTSVAKPVANPVDVIPVASVPVVADSVVGTVASSATTPDYRNSTEWAQSPRSPALRASDALRQEHNSWITPFGLGMIAALGLMLICGVIIWQFRTDLFPSLAQRPVQTELQSIGGPAADVPAQSTAKEPARRKSKSGTPGFSEFANNQDIQRSQALPNATRVDPNGAEENSASQLPRNINSNTPVQSQNQATGGSMREPEAAPAQREPAVTPTANLNSEAGNPQPSPGTSTPPSQTPIAAAATIAPVAPVIPAGSVEIVLDPYPSIRVPPELKAQGSKPGVSLRIGHITTKIEPIYPRDALQQRTSGTVKIHVLIGPSGAVETAQTVDGSSGLLAEAALRAIQQWRFEPTLLDRTAIEAEEDVTVIFRLVTSPSR